MLFLPELGLAPKNTSRDGANHMRGMGIYAHGLGMRVLNINVEPVYCVASPTDQWSIKMGTSIS